MKTKSYAAQTAQSPLAPHVIERREVGAKDIAIDILYCGVCHSDLHTARGEWGGVRFPCVPGHEIVGKVREIGSGVTNHRVGDIVGVGCMVGSCRECAACDEGLEQYCESDLGFLGTYNGHMRGGDVQTYGGYSAAIVVDEHFVLKISHSPDQLAAVAPLLCAGITTWSPLQHWKAGPGKKVGVVGIGGLGHMGIKLAAALGAEVVAFTSSPAKRQAALDLGAGAVIVSSNKDEMAHHQKSFDLIINTVAAPHVLDDYLTLLKRDGVMVMVGAPSEPHSGPAVFNLIGNRRSLAGSLIGGIKETQEMLDFCAQHQIVSTIEMIKMAEINQAYDRMIKSDVKYRFVIDMASL